MKGEGCMTKGLVDLARWRLGVVGGVLALAAFLLGEIAVAQTQENGAATRHDKPGKPAWQWTLEERLEARFNPEAMKARSAREAELAKKTAAQFGERFDFSPDQHSIDGKREPELFLPGELFHALLSDAFPDNALQQEEMRSRIEERAAVIGFGSDLWIRLERVAAPYLRLRDERNLHALEALARSEAFEDSEKDSLARCRALARALADAKAEFGDKVFLRLLYEAKAPTMSLGYSSNEGLSDRLRFMEGGCQ
jgi:hypothetical protein